MRTIAIELDGNTYLWSGSSWTDERFLAPPSKVRPRLMPGLIQKLERTANRNLDAELVTRAAAACRDTGRLDDAAWLAQRVLRADPSHVDAAIVASKQRDPRTAVAATDSFTRRRRADLHTVRAAALADLGEWEAAEKAALRAMALDADTTRETLRVMARVMNAKVKAIAA